jgi:hypothetical protein
MSGSSLCRQSRRLGRGLGLGLAGLIVSLAGLNLGCQPVVPGVIMGADGPVSLADITAVFNDPDLADDAARRQALRDLGITDEALIDVLIAEGASL